MPPEQPSATRSACQAGDEPSPVTPTARNSAGARPKFIYLHGFASGPSSQKARFFRECFASEGIDLAVPDLADDDFEHLTISGQLRVIEREAAGGEPVALIGSSLGGYLAALFAARHPEVTRLVLLAPAFAFARRWSEEFPPMQFEMWKRSGTISIFHYSARREMSLGFQLIEDGLQYEDYPQALQPTLILHGRLDTVVPPHYSEEFAQSRPNVRLRLLDSDHQLTDVAGIMWDEVRAFLLP